MVSDGREEETEERIENQHLEEIKTDSNDPFDFSLLELDDYALSPLHEPLLDIDTINVWLQDDLGTEMGTYVFVSGEDNVGEDCMAEKRDFVVVESIGMSGKRACEKVDVEEGVCDEDEIVKVGSLCGFVQETDVVDKCVEKNSDDHDDVETKVKEGEISASKLVEIIVVSDDDEEDDKKGSIKSKNEIKVISPVPFQSHHTLPVGFILSIVGTQIIVESVRRNSSLDVGSILWITERGIPLGLVDEAFGPEKTLYYVVRFKSQEEVPDGIRHGTLVSFVPEFAFKKIADQKHNQDVLAEALYDMPLADPVECISNESSSSLISPIPSGNLGQSAYDCNAWIDEIPSRENPEVELWSRSQMQNLSWLEVDDSQVYYANADPVECISNESYSSLISPIPSGNLGQSEYDCNAWIDEIPSPEDPEVELWSRSQMQNLSSLEVDDSQVYYANLPGMLPFQQQIEYGAATNMVPNTIPYGGYQFPCTCCNNHGQNTPHFVNPGFRFGVVRRP